MKFHLAKNVLPSHHLAMRVLQQIQEKVGPVAIIAGGAPTCMFTGRVVNDYDIYVGDYKSKVKLTDENYEEYLTGFDSLEFQDYHNFEDWSTHSDIPNTPDGEKKYEYLEDMKATLQLKINGIEFDIIQKQTYSKSEEDFMKHVLEDFDMNICKNALTSMGHLYVSDVAKYDYDNRIITVNTWHMDEDRKERTEETRLPKYLKRFEAFKAVHLTEEEAKAAKEVKEEPREGGDPFSGLVVEATAASPFNTFKYGYSTVADWSPHSVVTFTTS